MTFGPGATIGILGHGQLGRMIGVAARQMGYGVVVFGPAGDAPAMAVADRGWLADWTDEAALDAFAEAADVVTYEFENVPVSAVERVAVRRPVRPGAALLGWTQDRLAEHALLDQLGIPHARGAAVYTAEDLDAALDLLGWPSRLKTARGGYDGGGQWRIRDADEAARARAVVAGAQRTFRVERDVAFEREISVIVARGPREERVFPVFENEHRDGILSVTRWPARVSDAVAARAREIARAIADHVGLVGTLTVECFVAGDEVLVNELAPRVHNSGHLTIEACAVSQFAQHVRAVCGLPLAEPTPRSAAAMVNLLGPPSLVPGAPLRPGRASAVGVEDALAAPEAHLHLYGKAEARPRRKLGHLTVLDADPEAAVARALAAAAPIRWG